jgi:hypothetical protein
VTRTISPSAALPIAHFVLRILTVGNWISGLGILALLFVTPYEEWIISALKIPPSLDATRVIVGMRGIMIAGLVGVGANYVILKRLLAIVDTVRAGDPFIAANAPRLQAIAWGLLALQLVGMVIDGIAKAISTPAHPIELDAGFSINGWLAVLLTFVLARVFAAGTSMRDDLEGTI